MADLTGKDGAVSIASTGTLAFRSWGISYSTIAIDVTAFGDTARNRAVGIKDWTGTAEAILDSAAAPSMPTAEVAVTLTAASGRTWVGNAIVTEIGPAVVIDGEATCSVSLEGTGDLTLN